MGKWLSRLLMAVLVCVVLGAGVWMASGGRMFMMTTGSMSPEIPVGSLVLAQPSAQAVRVGQIVVFQPPGQTAFYVHKVVAVKAGGYETKGIANSMPDPWLVPQSRVFGPALRVLPGAGYALEVLPIAAVAWILLLLIWSSVPKRYRPLLAVAAMDVVLGVVTVLFHPLTGVQVIDAAASHGLVKAYVVSTGLLPQAVSVGGAATHLAYGQLGVVQGLMVNGHGIVQEGPYLPLWGLGLVALWCALPLVLGGYSWNSVGESEAGRQVPVVSGSGVGGGLSRMERRRLS
ncbi:MAG: signal peptidase I [Leptospirillum sp.]